MRFRISKSGKSAETSHESWSTSEFTDTEDFLPGLPHNEAMNELMKEVTYPRFVNIDKDLLLTYRIGQAGQGSDVLFKYSSNTHEYTFLGQHLTGVSNSPYINGIDYRMARLHISWCYRNFVVFPESASLDAHKQQAGPNGPENNHDLNYAFSEDCGKTWRASDGRNLAIVGDPPKEGSSNSIMPEAAGVRVFEIPMGSGILNQEAQATDWDGGFWALNREKINNEERWIVYYRGISGNWTKKVVSSVSAPSETGPRGSMCVDKKSNVYVVLAGNFDDSLSIMQARKDQGYQTFETIWSGNGYDGEPLVDIQRLEESDILLYTGFSRVDLNSTNGAKEYLSRSLAKQRFHFQAASERRAGKSPGNLPNVCTMAPKNLPPAAKQAKILDWFRESMSVYTLKELEKGLPSVASINQMQVKDYLQALQDENLIRVEKIGSGNWYWYFMSDAKKTKENMLNGLKADESKLTSSITDTERHMEEEIAKREEDEEMLEDNGMDRKALLEVHEKLIQEMEKLDNDLACYSDNDPAEIMRKLEETKKLKDSAIRWTDNIEAMESFIANLMGDRARAAELLQSTCGDEYVTGGIYAKVFKVFANLRLDSGVEVQHMTSGFFKRFRDLGLGIIPPPSTCNAMCANATPTPTASTSPFAPTGRSLLSRLTSPLKSRSRNLSDFHIRPDEPHRRYSPGDLVKGAVILEVVKPVRLTHLIVCLHGFVRVFKHPNDANEPLPHDTAKAVVGDPKKSQYFGNGHASLFQDEETLCGEGRLEPGVYEFNFELEFPSKGLPTSIDLLNLEQYLWSLSPGGRRGKKTARSKENGTQEANDPSSGSEVNRAPGSPLPDESASQCGSLDHTANPRSPTHSDVQSVHSAATSADSTISSSTGLSFRLGPVPSSAKSARDSQGTGSKVSLSEKTITATIELLKSGCLAGDILPLKISIKHTKPIKSMHGIIITLYRQGRIDSAPPLSLFTNIKGKAAERLKHEEYYPKSKTGLGGLSLMSAGSSSVFRKDLAQTFAPILVDPHSLTAEISASVRVPEDVFPTISGVPGEMISFKYLVEVVVDLGGKLAGQQRHVPRVGTTSNYGNSNGVRSDANMLAAWGGNIVDTDHIRREKSVVACLFEVVVGSTDSARRRGRGNDSVKRQINDFPLDSPVSPVTGHERSLEEGFAGGLEEQPNLENLNPYPYPYPYPEHPYEEEYFEYYPPTDYDYSDSYYPEPYMRPAQAQLPVPPPHVSNDEGVSEKERLRRAEERLLPSQPPPDNQDEDASSSRTPFAPTAPTACSVHPVELLDDLYDADNDIPQAGPSSPPPLNTQISSDPIMAPSAPLLEDFNSINSNTTATAIDDKQELERRRLQAEASAPLDFSHDEDDNAGEGSSRPQFEPSAPILTEEDEYGQHYERNGDRGPASYRDTLPRYER
ncbi:hypothetical protein G7Y89_g12552 [Cudoniella acicularis]|uniref:Arrestin C-terminal-like domain-containing protein n=1 Tax=Cudoniella acicularis TaxID=354080 RepID=A0A8H4RCD3_9HELO|nr:hypothetical protein G7Y89_g12552 [Cudoniella acicularis]